MNKLAFLQETARELSQTFASVDQEALEGMIEDILGAERIFIAGAGRTLLMMRAFAMSLMQIGLSCHVIGDTTTPAITAADLLIAASYSGRTMSTSLFVDQAAECGARIVFWSAHPDSSIARRAHRLVVIRSASDDVSGKMSVQYEGNGFEHALVPLGDAVVRFLCDRTGANEAVMLKNHANLE